MTDMIDRIELIATAESAEQAKALLAAGIDTIYVGGGEFGLRLPASLDPGEIGEIVRAAREQGARVTVAVNGILHNDRIGKVTAYLQKLREIGVDAIAAGDPGVIRLLRVHDIGLPYIYDAHTIVTSARQINFWAKRGAVGAVLARELTFDEIKAIRAEARVPVEVQVYGATCIHHSKRPLVDNYLQHIREEDAPRSGLYIAEIKDPDKRYSIYEDEHGTHIFAAEDINLLPRLGELAEAGVTRWKLDGLFVRGDGFVGIARLFIEAKQAILEGEWSDEFAGRLNRQLAALQPAERPLGAGFFVRDAAEIQ